MIDLRKAYEENSACMESRPLLKSVLEELYPNNRNEIDAVLAVYDEGFYLDIAEDKGFYKAPLNKLLYAQTLIDHYDIDESGALISLKSWYVFYHGKEFHGKEFIVRSEEEILLRQGNAEDFELKDAGKTGELEIVKFLGFDTEIMTIPNIVDGQKVTALGNEAYFGCRYVKKIIVPEGIEIIGDRCFANCFSLESIQLPQSLKTIPDCAFLNCNKLNEVIMGNQITKIGNYAFEDCVSLKSITLPDSVKVIGRRAFTRCENITKITLSNQVMEIGSYAFLSCQNLQSLVLPDSLKKIDCEAFSRCDGLTQIEFPPSITRIDKLLFSQCDKLQEIIFNEGLIEIGTRIYSDCRSLKRILLPRSLNAIKVDDLGSNPYAENLIIYCYPGSYALQYAKKHGYPYADASNYEKQGVY